MPAFYLRFFIICTSLLIGACSILPPANTSKQIKNSWTLSGKIGVTTPDESVAGFIRWQQQDDNFDIYVSGPLNAGSTHIQGNLNTITLKHGGKTISGVQPQKLIYQQLGWHFPLQNLPFWLQGKAAPYSQAQTQSEDGHLTHIQQDKWSVELRRQHSYYNVPQRIKISQGDWKFLFVAKNWSFD